MTEVLTKLNTALALGIPNLLRVASYRLGIKLGVSPVRRLRAEVPLGPFFYAFAPTLKAAPAPAVSSWQTSALLFSRWSFATSAIPPDWLANPLTGRRVASAEQEWWRIPDFDAAVGDIKLVWELSRMDWVLAFAQRTRHGDEVALARLNQWLADWCRHNPPYYGPNWKCGQEASIRVMHLAMAALILGQIQKPLTGLRDLICAHLRRIAPTVQYAKAQDNNHGTSEAAALFIGGSWLVNLGVAEADQWQKTGRRLLEDCAARLIGSDGTFSQYSVNYHRVMLDTFCMAEVWRVHTRLPQFCSDWYERSLLATQWLRHIVNSVNGDAPNVGANDGARLLQLANTPYRDFRPTVQLAMALFAKQCAYPDNGAWNDVLRWLEVPIPQTPAPQPHSRVADDGGFVVLRRGAAMAMLRYPRFKFRPSHADVLHVDFWLGGENLLRDAGTFSYNTDANWQRYFGGTAGHNTVQFDDRDQMPRLGRFLFGNWLKASTLEPLREDAQASHFGAGYRDSLGGMHRRKLSLHENHLQIVDHIGGFTRKAVLRWRLPPGDWHLSKTHAEHSNQGFSLDDRNGLALKVASTVPILRCGIVDGWESRHYLQKTFVPVLEIEVSQRGVLTTDFAWSI